MKNCRTLKNPKATEAVKKLDQTKRDNDVLETFRLVCSLIDKLIVNSEFKTVQKIAISIMNNKHYATWQKTNYETALNFTSNFGGQPKLVNTKEIDLTESTDKLIAVTLKEKKVINK